MIQLSVRDNLVENLISELFITLTRKWFGHEKVFARVLFSENWRKESPGCYSDTIILFCYTEGLDGGPTPA